MSLGIWPWREREGRVSDHKERSGAEGLLPVRSEPVLRTGVRSCVLL